MSGDFTGHDMAQAREDGYSAGVQLATEYERILTDLIAELRVGCGRQEEAVGPLITTHRVREYLDRAEARLREVGIG